MGLFDRLFGEKRRAENRRYCKLWKILICQKEVEENQTAVEELLRKRQQETKWKKKKENTCSRRTLPLKSHEVIEPEAVEGSCSGRGGLGYRI